MGIASKTREERELWTPYLRPALGPTLNPASSVDGAGRAERRLKGWGRGRSVRALWGRTGHQSGPLRAAPEEVPSPSDSNLFFLVLRRQGLTVGLWEGSCRAFVQVTRAWPYGSGHSESLAAG